jgi:hypothetical protein
VESFNRRLQVLVLSCLPVCQDRAPGFPHRGQRTAKTLEKTVFRGGLEQEGGFQVIKNNLSKNRHTIFYYNIRNL